MSPDRRELEAAGACYLAVLSSALELLDAARDDAERAMAAEVTLLAIL